MKVTFCSLEYPPNIYGGVGVYLSYLTKELKKKIDVEVRTVCPKGGKAFSIENGIKVRRYLPWKIMKNKALEAFSLCLSMVNEPIEGIIHTNTWYANIAGLIGKRLYNLKSVATVHSLEPLRPWKEEQLGSAYRLSCWMEEEGLKDCDKIIAVSTSMKEDIMKCYNISGEKIEVVHNGVDLEKYRKIKARAKIKKPYILFVGRLTKQKGIFDLVDASERIKAKVLLLTGKPDTNEIVLELKRKIRGKKNIIWLNKMVDENELINIYSNASVFVCPSIYEPFGIIVLEAMACELPVVATNVGGIKETMIDRKTGYLVEPNNALQLADAVNEI
ncbi:MAG: glycogen synthase, partial [Candidatus Thermoplasmatota archaeon]